MDRLDFIDLFLWPLYARNPHFELTFQQTQANICRELSCLSRTMTVSTGTKFREIYIGCQILATWFWDYFVKIIYKSLLIWVQRRQIIFNEHVFFSVYVTLRILNLSCKWCLLFNYCFWRSKCCPVFYRATLTFFLSLFKDVWAISLADQACVKSYLFLHN